MKKSILKFIKKEGFCQLGEDKITEFNQLIKNETIKFNKQNEYIINDIYKKEFNNKYTIFITNAESKKNKGELSLSIILLMKETSLLKEEENISTFVNLLSRDNKEIKYDRFIETFSSFNIKYIMTFLIKNSKDRDPLFISKLLNIDFKIVNDQIEYFNSVMKHFPDISSNQFVYRIDNIHIKKEIKGFMYTLNFINSNNILIIQILNTINKNITEPIYILNFKIKDFSEEYVLFQSWSMILESLILSNNLDLLPQYQKYINVNELDSFLNNFQLEIKKKVLTYLI